MTFEPLNERNFRIQRERTPLELALGLQPYSLSDQPQPEPTPPSSPAGYFLSYVPSKPLTWLWPGRIPLGHLTLLDAAPGSGLSLFALTLAACVSSGSPFPDGTPTQQGNVILFAPYDDASDTLKPRLLAAGCDPDHVMLFRPFVEDTSRTPTRTRPFALPQDLEHLSATIRRVNARLLILDPASALPGLSRCLPFLLGLAHATNCAILLTRSLRQPPADPLRSPNPSSPLLAAARSRLLLAPDPADERHHLLLTTRHPLCAQPPILSYDILASAAGIPTIHWLGERDRSQLARLCTGPLRSPQRQTILRFLHNSASPHNTQEILEAACYDYTAGRKLLFRMKIAGELVTPTRGLYTTPNHPCLAQPTNETPPVPTVPNTPAEPPPHHGQGEGSGDEGLRPLQSPSLPVPTVPETAGELSPHQGKGESGADVELGPLRSPCSSPSPSVPPVPTVPITNHLTSTIPTDPPVPSVPNPVYGP